MSERSTTSPLPDGDVLEQAALEMVDVAPDGWTDLQMVMWYEAPDVYGTRMWVEGPHLKRARIMPPHADRDLDRMRSAQVAAGQEAWQRCDLRVTREPGSSDPQFSADFAYDVGAIPD